ncbi:MAG: HEAT repeat domain-containing protein [bacterium]
MFRAIEVCLRIFALYAQGHPARNPALGRAYKKVDDLLKNRGYLYLGVAEEELIVFTDDEQEHRLVTDIAKRFHQLGILTLKINSGFTQQDLDVFLGYLSRTQESIEGNKTIKQCLQESGIASLSLSMVDYRQILEQEPSAAPDQEPADFWTALIKQGREGNETALRKMAESFQEPSRYRELREQIQKSLEDPSGKEGSDVTGMMSEIQQKIFSGLPSSEKEAFSKNIARLALSGEPASPGTHGDMDMALMNCPDEMLLHVMASAVVLQGKMDNRISTTFKALLTDQTRERSLLGITDKYSTEKSSAGYPREVWDQIRTFILSGSEDQFMSREYHQVLDNLHKYHLGELRESINMDYLHQVQSSLHSGVLQQIRRDRVCELILAETREEFLEGHLAELVSHLSEYARQRDMGRILQALGSLFPPDVQIQPLKKKKIDEALSHAEEGAWITPLICEIGSMGKDDLVLLKKIFSGCRHGLPDLLIRHMGEERSIAGRKRLSSLLIDIGSDAIHSIVKSLSDDRWFLVRNLVMVLGKIGNPFCMEYLLPLLSGDNYRVQREVVYTLSLIGGDQAVHPIRKILLNRSNQSTPGLREVAALALKRIGTPRSRKVLQEGLEDRDKKVQEICCQVLKGLT